MCSYPRSGHFPRASASGVDLPEAQSFAADQYHQLVAVDFVELAQSCSERGVGVSSSDVVGFAEIVNHLLS